jgi:predicted nucleic acid-binding protein
VAVSVGRKILLDTNVFIDYLRVGAHANWVTGRGHRAIRFLSSVVLMELRLGADTLPRRRAVDRIKGAFPAQRLIAPAPDLFDRTGVLFRALHGDGRGLRDRLGVVNDLLIALSAWRIGATVVTANMAEFARIQRHLPALSVVPPSP